MLFRFISPYLEASDEYDSKKRALNNDAASKATIDANYFVLSVLDTKASALMRLDSILVAAALVGINHLYELHSWRFALLVFPCLISLFACLLVTAIDWPFLGFVTQTGAEFNFGSEIENLRKVRQFRETMYQLAWGFTLFATLMFAIAVLWTLCS